MDCSLKLRALEQQRLAELERAYNHTIEQMESMSGVSLGGKFPQRPQPVYIGKTVLNNIRIADSQIGVLNTGSIGSIDSAISIVRESGATAVASALAAFTEAVAKSDLSTDQKRDAIDMISTIANEAAAPADRRRPAVVRALAVDISQLVSGAVGLAQLWSMYGGAIKAFFGLP